MSIFFAVLFTFVCWTAGLLFAINFGVAWPQYGDTKFKWKYGIFFWTGLLVLFIGLPLLWVRLVM